ncbi:hypothetical protein IAR55_006316 [Kwoniella newhampshirensis]|uniref:Uncharacterized protein n=1 Tax=Kwoniella newhampshirensis TaxID=1651941 RepID=A0AAW0YV35_9TREE
MSAGSTRHSNPTTPTNSSQSNLHDCFSSARPRSQPLSSKPENKAVPRPPVVATQSPVTSPPTTTNKSITTRPLPHEVDYKIYPWYDGCSGDWRDGVISFKPEDLSRSPPDVRAYLALVYRVKHEGGATIKDTIEEHEVEGGARILEITRKEGDGLSTGAYRTASSKINKTVTLDEPSDSGSKIDFPIDPTKSEGSSSKQDSDRGDNGNPVAIWYRLVSHPSIRKSAEFKYDHPRYLSEPNSKSSMKMLKEQRGDLFAPDKAAFVCPTKQGNALIQTNLRAPIASYLRQITTIKDLQTVVYFLYGSAMHFGARYWYSPAVGHPRDQDTIVDELLEDLALQELVNENRLSARQKELVAALSDEDS